MYKRYYSFLLVCQRSDAFRQHIPPFVFVWAKLIDRITHLSFKKGRKPFSGNRASLTFPCRQVSKDHQGFGELLEIEIHVWGTLHPTLMCACARACVRVHACVRACLCVWERQTDKEIDRQTDRQKQRQNMCVFERVFTRTHTCTHARTHAHTHTHTRTQTSKQAGAPFTKLDLTSYMHVRQNDHQSVWHMSWRAFNSTDWRRTMCVCVCVVECCVNCTPWLNYTHTQLELLTCVSYVDFLI